MSNLERLAQWIADHGVKARVDHADGAILCAYWVYNARTGEHLTEHATVRTMTQARRLLGY